jgi:molybdenum cofactor cytidylyltransferase
MKRSRIYFFSEEGEFLDVIFSGLYSGAVESVITPIILAAGNSSRMGTPKALCDFEGYACLELVLSASRGIGQPIVVLGAAREEIQSKVDLSGIIVVLNEDQESGQTVSFKIGLRALPAEAEAFLLFPVDTPLVTIEDVDFLIAAYRRERDLTKEIFIPSYGLRRGHPVLFRRSIAEEILALRNEAPARSVLNIRPQRIRHVDFQDPYVLMDMDTPEDYDRCLGSYRTRKRKR